MARSLEEISTLHRYANADEAEPELESGFFSCWNCIFHSVNLGGNRNPTHSNSPVMKPFYSRSQTTLPEALQDKNRTYGGYSNASTRQRLAGKNESRSNKSKSPNVITDQPISLQHHLQLLHLHRRPDAFHTSRINKIQAERNIVDRTPSRNRNDDFLKSRFQNSTSVASPSVQGPEAQQPVTTPVSSPSCNEEEEYELSPGWKRLLRLYIKCGADFGDEIVV